MTTPSSPLLLPEFKAGGTFSLVGTARLPAGAWTGACQIRKTNGALISNVEVTLGTAADGDTPLALFQNDTAGWPEGVASVDIVFTDSSGFRLPSPTFLLPVAEQITRAA